MEFTEAATSNAIKFLQDFVSKDPPADSCQGHWASLKEFELEGVCLELARNYLARSGCPGFLSYHISAEVVRRISELPLDLLKEEDSDERGSEQQALSGSVLGREVLQCIRKVCVDWLSSFPPLTCPRERMELSFCAIKNTRRKMEDRYSMCLDINGLFGLKEMPDQSFFGVYDGHMGVDAAMYTATFLLTNIVRHSSFAEEPATAIKEGIKITDQQFCQKGIVGGTTAVLALLRGKRLYLGWLGDSEAVVFKKGVPLDLMEPHRPGREDEQERIDAAGGMVLWIGGSWRVNGNLSVSRAIGDARDKKFVIGEADVEEYQMDGTEDYLVVACDGVWDVLDSKDVSECVYRHLSAGEPKNTAARCITEAARREGSTDNITVIVVFFSSFELVQPSHLGSAVKEEEEEEEEEEPSAPPVDTATPEGTANDSSPSPPSQ